MKPLLIRLAGVGFLLLGIAHVAIETSSFAQRRPGGRRSAATAGVSFLPSSKGMGPGAATNMLTCGDWTELDGAAKLSCTWEYKCGAGGCNAAATNQAFWRRQASNNTQFAFESNTNNFAIAFTLTAAGSFNRKSEAAFYPAASQRYRAKVVFDGSQPDEDRWRAWITDDYHGRRAVTLSDSGVTLPTTLPAVSGTPTEISSSANNLAFDWIDNFACWFGYAFTDADMCRLDGGTWNGSACVEGLYSGEFANPLSPDVIATRPNVYYTFGELGDSAALIKNRANPGTYDCTASDGSVAFVDTSVATNLLPYLSARNRGTNELTPTELDADVVWKFRAGRGYGAHETINSTSYYLQPSMYRIDSARVRAYPSAGPVHADPAQFGREILSRDGGYSWPLSLFTPWPYSSAGLSSGRSLSVTDVTSSGNGDRGFACDVVQSRTAALQGLAWCHWVARPTTDRFVRLIRATDWTADQPTWTIVTGNFFESQSTDFQASPAHPWVETFAGNWLAFTWNGDTGDLIYHSRFSRCGAADDCSAAASWDESWMLDDGRATSPTYSPEEPTGTLLRGGPKHGSVLLCMRTASTPPGGFQSGECTCTWIDNPDDATPTVTTRAGAVGGSKFDWSTGEAMNCANTPTVAQLSNGVIALVVRDEGVQANYGDLVFYRSDDDGATWTKVGNLTSGQSALTRLVNVVSILELSPGVILISYTYELESNSARTTMLFEELVPTIFDDGPMPAWSNDGCLRLNDGGATNESLIVGDLKSFDGKAGVTLEFRARKTAAAGADTALFNQWGASDAASSFIVRLRSSGRIEAVIENGGSDCVMTSANSAWSANAWHHVALVGPSSPALYVDGTAVATGCTSGSAPSSWPSPSGSEARFGLHYDGSEVCSDCYFDEAGAWDYAASGGQIATAGGAATDVRARGWTRTIDAHTFTLAPLHYWPFEGSAGSDLKDSPSNLRVLDYGFVTAKLRGDCSNCEAADIGAAIP